MLRIIKIILNLFSINYWLFFLQFKCYFMSLYIICIFCVYICTYWCIHVYMSVLSWSRTADVKFYKHLTYHLFTCNFAVFFFSFRSCYFFRYWTFTFKPIEKLTGLRLSALSAYWINCIRPQPFLVIWWSKVCFHEGLPIGLWLSQDRAPWYVLHFYIQGTSI